MGTFRILLDNIKMNCKKSLHLKFYPVDMNWTWAWQQREAPMRWKQIQVFTLENQMKEHHKALRLRQQLALPKRKSPRCYLGICKIHILIAHCQNKFWCHHLDTCVHCPQTICLASCFFQSDFPPTAHLHQVKLTSNKNYAGTHRTCWLPEMNITRWTSSESSSTKE